MPKSFKSVEAALPDLLKKEKMLEILDIVEKDVLPALLMDRDLDLWQSLYIDYEKPFVERLWYQLGAVRINLHKIYPCNEDEALFHPHPWPSAMHVLSGIYETAIGGGISNERPSIAMKGVVSGEFRYEMTDSSAWHYVRPISAPAYTLMVIGQPYKHVSPKRVGHKSTKQLRELTEERKRHILDFCWNYYLDKSIFSDRTLTGA